MSSCPQCCVCFDEWLMLGPVGCLVSVKQDFVILCLGRRSARYLLWSHLHQALSLTPWEISYQPPETLSVLSFTLKKQKT